MSPDRTQSQPPPCHPPPTPAPGRVKVVGYDGSLNGPAVVEGAARRVTAGDRLVIAHAREPEPGRERPISRRDDICHQIYHQLHSTLDPDVLEGIDYELRVEDGPVAPTLMRMAREIGAAAIVIGTRRGPSRRGQRTIRAELDDGPVPVVAVHTAARETHPDAEPIDPVDGHGHDSFPASDPPPSWGGPDELPAQAPDRLHGVSL